MSRNGDFLREELKKHTKPADGSVINFTLDYGNDSARYEYVALYVAAKDRWYLSGLVGQRRQLKHSELMELLASDKAVAVRSAMAWDVIKSVYGRTDGPHPIEHGTPIEKLPPIATTGTSKLDPRINEALRNILWGRFDEATRGDGSASKGTHDTGNTVDWSRIDEGEQA